MTFFENTKTPKSMADCVAIDSTAEFLSRWSKTLKTIGKFFCGFGLVTAIILLLIGLFTLMETDALAIIILSLAGGVLLTGLFVFLTLNAFATLIQALACLVQNSKVSAMVAIYQTGEELPKIQPAPIQPQPTKSVPSTPKNPPPTPRQSPLSHVGDQPIFIAQQKQSKGTWVCPVCCRENSASKTVCACDYVRQESDTVHPASTAAKPKAKPTHEDELVESLPDTAWQCPACGLILPKDKEKCSCGYKKQ